MRQRVDGLPKMKADPAARICARAQIRGRDDRFAVFAMRTQHSEVLGYLQSSLSGLSLCSPLIR
jgi:hypothetical protein